MTAVERCRREMKQRSESEERRTGERMEQRDMVRGGYEVPGD